MILIQIIFYCYHDRKTHKKRANASPYGAGGLASSKPEENKGSKKADFKTLFFILLSFLLSPYYE